MHPDTCIVEWGLIIICAVHVRGPRPEGLRLGSINVSVPVVRSVEAPVCGMVLAPIVECPANKAKHSFPFTIPPVEML